MTLPTNENSPSGERPDDATPAPGEASPPSPASAEGSAADGADRDPPDGADARPAEIGGQKGPEPTRYGDWEKKGRCTDF